jgi:hypothetical protein
VSQAVASHSNNTNVVYSRSFLNYLFFVNGTRHDMMLQDLWRLHGQLDMTTVHVSAAPQDQQSKQKPMAYPSGIYLFSKVSPH